MTIGHRRVEIEKDLEKVRLRLTGYDEEHLRTTGQRLKFTELQIKEAELKGELYHMNGTGTGHIEFAGDAAARVGMFSNSTVNFGAGVHTVQQEQLSELKSISRKLDPNPRTSGQL